MENFEGRLQGGGDRDLLLIGYRPDNVEAERLYASLGFEAMGLAPWGEKLSQMRLGRR